MTWIIVRPGPYRYLTARGREDLLPAFTMLQRSAYRFGTKHDATRALLGWVGARHSSWPCRVVKLTRKDDCDWRAEKCPKGCGASLMTSWKFCPACGRAIDAARGKGE